MSVNPNEAPEGHIAVLFNKDSSSCTNCAFYGNTGNCERPPKEISCAPWTRKDNSNVYFVKKEEQMNVPIINVSKYWMVHASGVNPTKCLSHSLAISAAKNLSSAYPGKEIVILEAMECYVTSKPEPKRYEMRSSI